MQEENSFSDILNQFYFSATNPIMNDELFQKTEQFKNQLYEQLFLTDALNIQEAFRAFLFQGKNPSLSDFELLQKLDCTVIPSNWSFLSSIALLDIKATQAFYNSDIKKAFAIYNDILFFWIKNPSTAQQYPNLVFNNVYKSFFLTFILNCSLINTLNYDKIFEIIHANLHHGISNYNTQKLFELLQIIKNANLLHHNSKKALQQNLSSLPCFEYKEISNNYDDLIFFNIYIKIQLAIKIGKLTEALSLTNYIINNAERMICPNYTYLPSVIMTNLLLVYHLNTEDDLQKHYASAKKVLKDSLEHPFIDLFFNFFNEFIKVSLLEKRILVNEYYERYKEFKIKGGNLFLFGSFNFLVWIKYLNK